MSKYAAFGTILQHAASAIAQVEAISGPSLSLDTEDVTSHDSPNGWEELVATILRSGEVGLDLYFDPALVGHVDLIEAMVGRAAEEFTLVFPDTAATQWTFNAFVVGFEPDAPHDGALAASASLKITGEPTLATGTV